MFRKREWQGRTIVSYWHKGTKYAICMWGHFDSLDDMAAAAARGESYILRIIREN